MDSYQDNLNFLEETKCITVYTNEELQKCIDDSGIINISLSIRGLHIRNLNNVKIIKGYLSLEDTELEDLGDLEIIEGDFTIWNIQNELKFKTLGKLKIVKGDLRLRYTKIESLGNLETVGKNLILRDTNITNLKPLLEVGGDIYLPKKFKSIIDLSNINIKGKVKYWNDSKNIKTVPIVKRELSESELKIPHWEFRYIISHLEINHYSKEIQLYYEYFKKSFFERKFIDVRGESNYLFTLLLELQNTLKRDIDHPLLKEHYKMLSDCYPVLRHYTTRWIIDLVEKNKEFQYLRELLFDESNDYGIDFPQYFFIQNLNNDSFVDPEYVWKNIPNTSLTTFGLDNISDIKPFFNYRVNNSIDSDVVSNFRNYVKKWKRFNSISYNDKVQKEINLLISFYERLLRESENDLRESRGIPKIGEGWISETELYYYIKNEFSSYKVIHHGRPKWLGRQHLDIYIDDLNIGIEYMGSQHYQSIDFFGGDESLTKTIERDLRKRELCIQNNCFLLVVNEGYQLSQILDFIKTITRNPKVKPVIKEFPLES